MRALLLLSLVSLTGCGPLLFAEVEARTVCVGLDAIAFPGAGAASEGVNALQYDLGSELPVLEEPDVEFELRILRLRIAGAPGTDLSGIDRVRVLALPPPGSSLPAYEVLSYTRDPDAPAASVLVAGGHTNLDLGPYLESGRLDLRAEYAGSGLPAEDWTADVEGCFYVRALVDYGGVVVP